MPAVLAYYAMHRNLVYTNLKRRCIATYEQKTGTEGEVCEGGGAGQ